MTRTLDHVVIVVTDLTVASEKYRGMGFDVRPGGRHESMGTGNALMGLSDGTYLELFAFLETKGVDAHPLGPLAKAGGGLAVYWLSTDDVDGDVAELKTSGADYAPPVEMSRKRPDGTLVRFRLSTPGGQDWNVLPCLIQDITPRTQRVPESGAATNKILGIRSLDIATSDLDRIGRVFSTLSGRMLDKAASYLIFGFGDHRVVLRDSKSKSGLVSITLAGPTAGALPAADTMGATILLSPG